MKNHILALKNYDQEQNWSGLHEYLNELSEDILEYNFHVWTGKSYVGYDSQSERKRCAETKNGYAD